MLYVIAAEDRPDSLADRLAARPAHVARLQALLGEGRLILAGPCPAIDSPDPGPAGFSGQPDRRRIRLAGGRQNLGRRRPLRGRRRLCVGQHQAVQESLAGVSARSGQRQAPPGQGSAPGSFEALLRQRLAALRPLHLELTDDSARHIGHAGAASGGGHYGLLIVAPDFSGKSTLARHRLVYEALGELMRSQIHALSIRALAPEEAQQSGLLL